MEDNSPLLQLEAQALVEGLQATPPKKIGTRGWLRQHGYLQRLNTQAHVNVMAQRDDYIQDAFLSQSKISMLIHELIVMEMWTEKVYSGISGVLVKQPLTLHATLFHESLIVNMLELFFYHKEVIVEVPEDDILLLVDYCYRKLTYLNGLTTAECESFAINESSNEASFKFKTATYALSVARFMIENINDLPLSVLHRVVTVHDFLEAIAPLAVKSPWTVRVGKISKKFKDGNWVEIPRKDVPIVTKEEGQVWISLYVLCTEPEVLKKLKMSDHKRELLTKLRGVVTTVLIDQIPILEQLQRALDTLVVSQFTDQTSAFIIEEIPQAYEQLSRLDWDSIKKHIIDTLPHESLSRDEMKHVVDAMSEAAIKSHVCAVCGETAEHRCSKCRTVWYCTRECQVKGWKTHKHECIK